MWNRADLKSRAKVALRKDYWKAFLISLVIIFAGGGGSSIGGGSNNNFRNETNKFDFNNFKIPNWELMIPIIIAIIVIAIFVMIFAALVRILVGYPLEVGGRRYFIMASSDYDKSGCFTYAFNSKRYLKLVATMLRRGIQNFLWYLLFIIPGIIKNYEYRMVPYILAQNPEIGSKRAIELSRNMTMGHKFNIFVLDLSFIGWAILGLLACLIGVFFLQPYIDMTMAELYIDLRKEALDRGICSPEELNMKLA